MACSNYFTEEANFNPVSGFTDYPPYLCPVDNLTGYEEMATKITSRMLLTQYTNSPNLQEYMGAFVKEVDILLEEIHKVEFGRYIQNATGAQLDVIGNILQQTRNINIPKVWFGFQGANPVDGMADEDLPLAGGLFKSENEGIFATATPLSDIVYRKILLCRGFVLNQAEFDVNTVYEAIETALGKVPASIKLYEDTERNWILELDSEHTTTEEVGLLRAIQHWFIPMIVNLNIRLRLLKRLVNGLPIKDVLIYRAIDDDDEGAWLETTSGTSWYNEELNTLIRGKSKSFPEISLVIAEANKVTIYDATRTDLPMWIVFNVDFTNNMLQNITVGSISAKNGVIYVGHTTSNGMGSVDFINDSAKVYITSRYSYNGNIGERHDLLGFTSDAVPGLVDDKTNDIAITTDGSMGNIVYVATEGGLSRIATDGSVSNWTNLGSTLPVGYVTISGDYVQWNTGAFKSSSQLLFQLTNAPLVDADWANTAYWHFDGRYSPTYESAGVVPYSIDNETTMWLRDTCKDALATQYALTKLYPNPSDWGRSMVANITKDYNTGIMHGDIRGAWLADTDDADIGVDETTQYVVNGGFDTDSDWGKETGWSIGGGVASCDGSQTASTGIDQLVPLTIGKYYKVSVNVTAVSGTVRLQAYFLNNTPRIDTSVPDVISFSGIATASGSYVKIFALGLDDTCTIDDVSVVETGNLVDNGEFATDTNSWIGNDATIANVIGELEVTQTSASDWGSAQQYVPNLIVGKRYTLTGDFIKGTAASGRVYLNNALGEIPNMTSSQSWNLTFTATNTNAIIVMMNESVIVGQTTLWDNITLRLTDSDRSYNNNSLSIYGEIPRTPVATRAELQWYGNFFYGWFEQPYNPDLNFGTGDFFIMGWFTAPATTTADYIIDRYNGSGRIGSYISSDKTIKLNTTGTTVSSTVTYENDVPIFFTIIRHSNGDHTFRFNLVSEVISDIVRDVSDTTNNPALYIGRGYTGTNAFGGKMALLRMGAGAPTTNQLDTIYNQESKMFEVNAKCTLQGSTNDVKAVDYDIYRQTLKACCTYHQTTFKDLVVTEDEAAIATSVSTINGGVLTGGTSGAYYEI